MIEAKDQKSQFGRLRALVTATGLAAALATAIMLPLATGLMFTLAQDRDLALRAKIIAASVDKYIHANARLWPDQLARLEQVMEAAEAAAADVEIALKADGRTLLTIGEVSPRFRLSRAAPVAVAGTQIGTIEVAAPLQPVLVQVGWAAGIGTILAMLIFFAVRLLPVRALDEVLSDLEHTQAAMAAKTIALENTSHAARAVGEALRQQNEQLRETEVELRTQNYRFNLALDNMVQGLSMWDAEHRLIVANRVYREMQGLPAELVRPGTPLRTILEYQIAAGTMEVCDPDQFIAERCQSSFATSTFISDMADGRVISITRCPMANGGCVAMHEDITERRRADERIVHMAHHDALTNLSNRTLLRMHMEKALAQARSRGERFVLMLLDIDRFKSVNDGLGHPAGDTLLREVAARLTGAVRAGDTVARLGGDEFAILQAGGPTIDDARAMAQRLINDIAEPYMIDGQQITVSTSIGLAVAPDDSTDPDQLFRDADIALYRAKGAGRGTFRLFDEAMDKEVQARRALELELSAAFRNDDFELHYQPLVELASGEVTGFEALLRWRHCERGLVPPSLFVPIAEEIGLIGQLGAWVIHRACQDARNWPGEAKVAVNLSPEQFHSGASLLAAVVGALATTGLPARRLEIEITESVLLAENASTLRTLHDLRALGVSVSLDDFGTGYSSLSYLRKFPFDKIKIDQSFVRELSTRKDCAAIVRAVAGLAHTLGMTTVAEGVETEMQMRELMAEGCTEAQGYLFSPPLPNQEVAAMLAARTRYRAATAA